MKKGVEDCTEQGWAEEKVATVILKTQKGILKSIYQYATKIYSTLNKTYSKYTPS